MIKTYKNKVTGIRAVYQGGNSFKVIDASEPDDTNNIVMILSARDISTSKYWMPDLQEPEGVEVISMTNKYNLNSGDYWVRTDKGFKWSGWKEDNAIYYSAKDLLSSDEINKIYSVKRLSDGVVFTVGNKVCWDWVCAGDNKYFVIDSFKLIDGQLNVMLKIGQSVIGYKFFDVGLNDSYNYRHYVEKKVIFVSEDGVNMYKGDTYYWVSSFGNMVLDLKVEDALYTGPTKRYSSEAAAKATIKEVAHNQLDFMSDGKMTTVRLTDSELKELKELLK